MVRLKDIAREAGVSVMTVSKACGCSGIATKTKLAWRLGPKRMGYTPNLGPQFAQSENQAVWGCIPGPPPTPSLPHRDGHRSTRARARLELVLAHSWNQTQREETFSQSSLAPVDGFSSHPSTATTPCASLQELQQSGTRLSYGAAGGGFAPLSTCSHSARVGVLGDTTPIDLGHKRIAFFPGHDSRARGIHGRKVRRALGERHRRGSRALFFNAGMTIAEGTNAAGKFPEEQAKATAGQTVNDLVAIGAANVFLDAD
ncbi:MAG: hypothetical protein Ct9H300mP32_1480 [Verrucomicrobiota bacterium]|nr:MAG: hypothetical protein Ct9H300mP32_1480 [Verrucomicrobiota bacterium]